MVCYYPNSNLSSYWVPQGNEDSSIS
jgi:hypothetical protein